MCMNVLLRLVILEINIYKNIAVSSGCNHYYGCMLLIKIRCNIFQGKCVYNCQVTCLFFWIEM